MNMHELTTWVEANPGKSVLIGGGLVIFLLWIFGAFSKAAPADSGASLASAYYAAEAQQAVVGGQIQQANIAATASTAQALISANAAQAINSTNATAATTINQQQGTVVSHLADVGLSATQSNNATSLAGLQSNNATALAAHVASVNGAEALAFINGVIPQELTMTGGFGNFYLPNGQSLSVNSGSPVGNPNSYESMGFTPDQANQIALADLARTVPTGITPLTPIGTGGSFPENLLGV